MDRIDFMCWKCKANIEDEVILRTSECSVCHADLHSCRNCLYYSPGSHYDCHETIIDPVQDKEKGNFCDSFKVRREWDGSVSSAEKKALDAKKKFDSLFSI